MKTLSKILLIATLGYCPMLYGQNNSPEKSDSLIEEHVQIGHEPVTVLIPIGYTKTDTFNYMEGFIKTFVYPDESSISVLCGANANLSLSEDTVGDLHSRKIVMDYCQVTFDQVPSTRLQLFNRAFDLMTDEKHPIKNKNIFRRKNR